MSLIADRYASSQMRQVWSRESKVLKERELWITVMKAQAKLGLEISKDVLEDYERVKSQIDLSSIDRREAELKHDVKARIEEFNFLAGHQSIHVGLTSRDVTENIEGWQIKQSLHLTLASSNLLLHELVEKIEKYADLPIVGRTHNVPAQLTTLGRRFASWSEEFLFALDQMALLLDEVLFHELAKSLQLAERLVLGHVVLQVAAEVDLEQVAKVGDVVSCACCHLRQPRVQLVQAVHADHVIDVPEFF